MRMLTIAACVCGLLLTAAGAAGAHLMAPPDAEPAGDVVRTYLVNERSWDSALLYGFAHVLAALAVGLAPFGRLRLAAGWLFVAGVVLFAFTIVAKELLGGLAGIDAGWLSSLTPVGGILLMVAWIVFGAVAALHRPSVVIGRD